MPSEAGRPSPALLAANQRLYQLREAKRLSDQDRAGQDRAGKDQQASSSKRPPVSGYLAPAGVSGFGSQETEIRQIPELPEHLGWQSPAVTRALRAAIARQRPVQSGTRPNEPKKRPLLESEPLGQVADKQETRSLTSCPEVKLYPDLALGMLQEDQAAAGRIWLLLRHLDARGQGWLPLDQVKEALTGKDSELRVCGRRQLRNLLRQGKGIFWERDKERLWLKSVAKVAIALGVERLRGRPVALPVDILLSGIGKVRAHFYASFHSGRVGKEEQAPGSPISRAILSRLTGVPERSQRLYEQAAGIRVRKNIAVGESCTAANFQERAWRHGRGTFKFTDHGAKFGQVGQSYVAWRLPNSYLGCHQQRAKGRQKKINQQIDLVDKWAQGNDLPKKTLLFHHSAAAAAKTYNRDGRTDVYWPDKSGQKRPLKIWFVLPAQGR